MNTEVNVKTGGKIVSTSIIVLLLSIAFSAINTYSGWGTESGGHETDFLIAPKELDAEIVAGYDSEDPSVVFDCSDPALFPNVDITSR